MTKARKNAQPRYFKPVFAALLAALIVLLTFTLGDDIKQLTDPHTVQE